MATTYLIRKTGNDNNGGTSASIRSTGTDGVTNGTNTLTSATGTWAAGDIGHGIFIGGVNQWRLITAVASATSLTFSGATIASASGRTWTIGGSWLTIGKALGASGIASGDTVYIGAGVYREVVTVAMTSATVETQVIGDVDGVVTGDAGEVRWTAWTTDDKTAGSSSNVLELAGRDFLTFVNLAITAYTASAVSSASTGAATNITFRKCFLFSMTNTVIVISATGSPADTTLTWTIDSCIALCLTSGSAISVTTASSTVAQFNLAMVLKNSILFSFTGSTILLIKSGANSFAGGGFTINNCTIYGGNGVRTVTAGSTTYPMSVYNCIIQASSTGVTAANNTGEIIEDYNAINSTTARSNVTAGTNSKTVYFPVLNIGQAALFGFLPRPAFSPGIDSPMLGFGTDASVSLTTDILGRDRPSGSGITWASALKGVGAYEFHDFARKESTVTDAGDGWKLTGPGDQDILIPVDASATVLAIKTRYDTNHGTTNKPQAELIANASIGITGEVKTATVGVDTWETLTFSTFTATAKGWVTVRLRSRSAAGNGLCYFDTLTGV